MEALPTVFDLAECPEDKLLKLWEGLGYYSRARNLKKAAEKIVRNHSGKIPCEAVDLRALPGIGEYTAGAIASIAFGKPVPAVDGNVLRVLTRVLADSSDIMQASVRKDLTKKLSQIYPEGAAASDLTEGIMEIGERICIPNGAPQCEVCPLGEICLAFQRDLTDRIPQKSPKPERKKVPMTVLLLNYEEKYALRKRQEKGLLSGMWEFYHIPGYPEEEEILLSLRRQGFSPCDIRFCGNSKHVFTHLEWHMKGYAVTCAQPNPDAVWKTKEEILAEHALPTAFLFYLNQLI